MFNNILNLKNNLSFINPEYLVLMNVVYLLIALWAIVFVLWYLRKPQKTLGSRHRLMSRMLRFCLFLIAMLCCSIYSLARPYLPDGSNKFKKGAIEIIFIIDDSVSMWMEDVSPSRLERATRTIYGLYSSETLREGDRVALVVFGKTSLKKLRLSRDLNRFANEIGKLGKPEKLIGDDHYFASDIPLVLEDTYQFLDWQDRSAAYRAQYGKEPPPDLDWKKFNWRPRQRSDRIVVLFGDGDYRLNELEPEDKKRINNALIEFRRRGLKIFSVGIGTRQGAQLTSALRDYTKDKDYDDKLVSDLQEQGVTRLNTDSLNFLSKQTGGSVTTIESAADSGDGFLHTIIDSSRNISLEIINEAGRQELWREFLYFGLLLLFLGLIFY